MGFMKTKKTNQVFQKPKKAMAKDKDKDKDMVKVRVKDRGREIARLRATLPSPPSWTPT